MLAGPKPQNRAISCLIHCHTAAFLKSRKQSIVFWRSLTTQKRSAILSDTEGDILHSFWQARGVKDSDHRARLIEYGCSYNEEDSELFQDNSEEGKEPILPGLHALWHLERDAEQVQLVKAVTAKLLALQALLGNRPDIDVAGMLIKCPRLLTVTSSEIVLRLVKMKGTDGAGNVDLGKILEAQPWLLLQQISHQESPEAWRFGLTSSADNDWLVQLQALEEYKEKSGHVHVGFSSDDNADLARFARMQRAAFRKGILIKERREALEMLGFEFDADNAEWDFMYDRLRAAQDQVSNKNTLLDGGFDFLLNNWCSVQRISQRSGMLSDERIARLDAVDFDWTGADALS